MTQISLMVAKMNAEESLKQGQALLRQDSISVDDYKQLQEIVKSFPDDDRMPWLIEGAMAIASDEVLSYIYQEQTPGEIINATLEDTNES